MRTDGAGRTLPVPKSVAIVAAFLLLLPVAASASMTLRLPYKGVAVLGFDGFEAACAPTAGLGPLGTVCADVPPGAHALRVGAVDQLDAPVGGSWYLADGEGRFLAAGVHCGPTDLALPREAARLVVRVEGLNGPVWCLEEGALAPTPARGWVSLRFT